MNEIILEEILNSKYLEVKSTWSLPPIDPRWKKFAIEAMKQACLETLELSKNHVETFLWQEKDDLEVVGHRAEYLINRTDLKQSILNLKDNIK